MNKTLMVILLLVVGYLVYLGYRRYKEQQANES